MKLRFYALRTDNGLVVNNEGDPAMFAYTKENLQMLEERLEIMKNTHEPMKIIKLVEV